MRKMFKLLLILILIYFVAIQSYNFLKTKHNLTYEVLVDGKTYQIHEVFSYDKLGSDGYYINVSFDGYNIPIRLYGTFFKQKHIVNDVKVYEGDTYICVNVAIKGNYNATDIKCIKDGTAYLYSAIKGEDEVLDNAIASSKYDINLYTSKVNRSTKETIVYYVDNYMDKVNLLLADYKGAYIFGKKVTNDSRYVKLFATDQYTKPLETIVGKYYIVADYDSSHDFTYFRFINISTGAAADLRLNYAMSFNSFIQGTNEDSLYIIDIDGKEQHEINLKSKTDKEVGSVSTGAQVLINGKWSTMPMSTVIDNNIVFEQELIKPEEIDMELLNKVGLDNAIYYVYEKNDDMYDVYMVYGKDLTKTYAFTTTDIDRIQYRDGYVFYLYDDSIYAFRDDFGNKRIVTYTELKYNKNLHFYAY